MFRGIPTGFVLSVAASALLAGPAAAGPACPFSYGDPVRMQDPAQAFQRLSQGDFRQGEFETTQEFEERRAATMASIGVDTAFVVRTDYDPAFSRYDADNQFFRVAVLAWDMIDLDWSTVFPSGNRFNIRSSAPGAFGVGLRSEDSDVYGVFDRGGKGHAAERNAWKTIGVYEFPGTGFSAPYVRVAMARDLARRAKTSMQVGVLVDPQKPYAVTTVMPDGRKTRAILGDIRCVIFADENGKVLKTVERARAGS